LLLNLLAEQHHDVKCKRTDKYQLQLLTSPTEL